MDDTTLPALCTTPDLDAEALPLAALEDEITTLAATLAAATWRLLVLLAAFDRRQGWAGWGIHSCAHWLNWRCGIDTGAAREKLRVAHALADLPQINAAFAAGEMSYSKVRAMTRVATHANEGFLLMIARHGTAAHVERAVRAYRRVQQTAETEAANRKQATRALHWHYDDDGMLVIKARLPAESGALVLKALTAAQADLAADDPDVAAETSAGADEPFAARRADALAHLAEQFLAQGAVSSRQAERHQVVIHVEREALHMHGEGGRCELEAGPALAGETARRLTCDASPIDIEEDADGEPLNIGRRTRSVPPAIRRALTARDQGCRFPGCANHRYVDAHHVHHWADGGETSLRNLVLLCRYHHRLLHEGGFGLKRRDDGKWLFLRPEGIPVPDAPAPVVAGKTVDAIVAASGVHVSAETCRSQWRGERMDLSLVVLGLIQSDARAGLGPGLE